MLPGFNHNIRYKDKVFHVQTEDNGLDDPALVTQVFLGGQIIAIERSSYGEILVDKVADAERDGRIRVLMQDQHKRLLKNLVVGLYDAKIAQFAKSDLPAASRAPSPPDTIADAPARLSAAPIPTVEAVAPPPASQSGAEITAEALLAEDAELESRRPTSLIEDLQHAADQLGPIDTSELQVEPDRFVSDEELLRVIEEEMQRQLPWTPNAEAITELPTPAPGAEPPIAGPADQASEFPTEPPKKRNTPPPVARRESSKGRAIKETYRTPSPSEAATARIPAAQKSAEVEAKPGLRTPSAPPRSKDQPAAAGDTLVDFKIPAALRKEIDDEVARRARNTPPEDEKKGPWRVREERGPDPDAPLQRPGSSMPPRPDGRYVRVRVKSEKVELPNQNDTLRDTEAATLFEAQTPLVLERPPSRSRPPPVLPDDQNTPIERKPSSKPSSTRDLTPVVEKVQTRPPIVRAPSRTPAKGTPLPPPVAPSVARTKPPESAQDGASRTADRMSAQRPESAQDGASRTADRMSAQRPEKVPTKPPLMPEAPPAPERAEDPKRPSILVVERSLDEVILSYLYDEMGEK